MEELYKSVCRCLLCRHLEELTRRSVQLKRDEVFGTAARELIVDAPFCSAVHRRGEPNSCCQRGVSKVVLRIAFAFERTACKYLRFALFPAVGSSCPTDGVLWMFRAPYIRVTNDADLAVGARGGQRWPVTASELAYTLAQFLLRHQRGISYKRQCHFASGNLAPLF